MARAAKGEGTLFKVDAGWRGYVTVSGKRKYFSASTKAEASRKKRALLHQRDGGQLVTGRVPTVEAWLNHWMNATESDRAESTNAGYKYSMTKYIFPAIGNTKLDKLSIEDLESLYADMEKRGFAWSTRHQCHAVIRVALKQAVWRGHVGRNVAALVEPPRRKGAKPKISINTSTASKSTDAKALSEADVTVLYAALEADRFQARWHLSLDFGLRPGEAIALEWKHVDFKNNTISVEQEILAIRGKGAMLIDQTKSKAGTRVIALPEYVMEMLKVTRKRQLGEMAERGEDWKVWEPDKKPHAFCFTRADGSVLRPRYDSELWKDLLVRAGLPHTKRYNSRHTAASMAIADGADIASVAEMMGNNPSMTLSTYTHAIAERKLALAEQAASRYRDKVQNKVQVEIV